MNRLLLLLALAGSSLGAQSTERDTADKTFFTKRDAIVAGATLAGSAIVSAFDVRIAHWVQSTVVGDSSHYDAVENLTVVNETPLTLGALAVYGIGRLAGNEMMADVGLHTTEALVLTVGIAEAIRAPLGRSRPRESPNDQYAFRFGKGFTDFGARSYPSIHAAVAWAAATALAGEIDERKPELSKYAKPVLYTAALIPGFTRIYLNQHWASDVVAGSMMGALLGSKVVHYAHSHQRSKLDRILLGAMVVPDARGNVMVGASFAR